MPKRPQRKPSPRDSTRMRPVAPARDVQARGRAKELLREAGLALERGADSEGLVSLKAAVAADPTFVETALRLSAFHAAHGDHDDADALVEEAVRRGRDAVARLSTRPEGPAWWRDEATRPCLKALAARAARRLERGDAVGAAEQFQEVYHLAPEDDPLEAGVHSAEAWLAAADPMSALVLYARLEESAAVLYGRTEALVATGQRHEAAVSLWLAALVNSRVAEEIAGPSAMLGIDRELLVGDAAEAEDVAARLAPLWSEDSRELLGALLGSESFRTDLACWSELARALDAAESTSEENTALGAIETFLAPERIEARAAALLAQMATGGRKPKRLPLA